MPEIFPSETVSLAENLLRKNTLQLDRFYESIPPPGRLLDIMSFSCFSDKTRKELMTI